MANSIELAAPGLSGHAVRGMVDGTTTSPQAVADATGAGLEETVSQAAHLALKALDMTGEALGKAVDLASDKAFQEAANVGVNIATPQTQLPQTTFSWSSYVQALGIMCLLLAALWFAVWAIRRYGKFNFLPRPGSLPRDCLVMEAQMPLGPRKGLMVVRFMNHRLLLGVTEQQISLLKEQSAETGDTNTDKAGNARFEGFLQNARIDANNSGPDHN